MLLVAPKPSMNVCKYLEIKLGQQRQLRIQCARAMRLDALLKSAKNN